MPTWKCSAGVLGEARFGTASKKSQNLSKRDLQESITEQTTGYKMTATQIY